MQTQSPVPQTLPPSPGARIGAGLHELLALLRRGVHAIAALRVTWRLFPWQSLAELALVTAWAVWVGRAYLDFSPTRIPTGREFGEYVAPAWVWTLLPQCGDCVLWNGMANGGSPAFADIHSPVLHPIVMLATLLFGGLNGAKASIVATLALAGVAQWWLAKVMGLRAWARLWSAGLAVVGGHLSGRMEDGALPLILPTAAVALVLAPGLDLALTGRRRAAVALGVVTALALVSGNGYYYLGLAVGYLPAFAVFLFRLREGRPGLSPIWREFALAALLALLLSAVYWLPVVHFYPQFAKDLDPYAKSVQPLAYAPLNLVIGDTAFFGNAALQKQPFPFLYVNYIGWVPILLALAAVRLSSRAASRTLWFLASCVVLVFLAGSAVTFRLVAGVAPTFLMGIRNPSVICGLAVPPLLAMAAWGLDELLRLGWPKLSVGLAAQGSATWAITLSMSWLLAIPLVLSIQSAYDFGRNWLTLGSLPENELPAIQALKTASAQWVTSPYGEQFWFPYGFGLGLKMVPILRPWRWQGHPLPAPYLETARKVDDKSRSLVKQTIAGLSLVLRPENEYALVVSGAITQTCTATALGGHITVDCDSQTDGILTVRENSLSGWTARLDGRALDLRPGPWLSVALPAGQRRVEFRYLPWDVVVGAFLTLAGIVWGVWLYARNKTGPSTQKVGDDELS